MLGRGSAELLDLARQVAPAGVLCDLVATAHAMSDQEYAGSDMHIQLPFPAALYTKVLSNPGFREFQEYIYLGEQATWPRIEMIRDRTRLSRLFGTHIGLLMQRIAARDRTGARARARAAKRKS